MNAEDLKRLQSFVETVQKQPQLLHIPQLKFFKDYLQSLGAAIPPLDESKCPEAPAEECKAPQEEEKKPSSPAPPPSPPSPPSPPPEESSSSESDLEISTDGVVEPETRDPPEMGDESKLVSEDDEVAAGEKRSEAMCAMGEGDFDKAVEHFTEAIKINPGSAMLYAKRANVLIKQDRVIAARRDCDMAIKLNPDSATAYKFRGRVHRLLGNWIEAAKDLRLACKLDCDEQAMDWLAEVAPQATVIEAHARKYERRRAEKEINAKKEKIRKHREAATKAAKEAPPPSSSNGFEMPDDMGGMGGLGGFPNYFKDPDFLETMKDPEVAAAFQDISTNPSNIYKYQSNPKIAAVISKLMKKMGGMPGGMGGMPGGMPGGMGGMPGGMGGMPGGMGGMPEGFPGGMGGMPEGFPGGMPGFSGMPDFGSAPKAPKSPGDDLD